VHPVEHHRKSTSFWLGEEEIGDWILARRMALVPDSRSEARAVERWYIGTLTVASLGFGTWLSGMSLLGTVASQPKGHQDLRMTEVGAGLVPGGFAIMFAMPFTHTPSDRHLYRAIDQYNAAAERNDECPVSP
jgi:hypothetical protein